MEDEIAKLRRQLEEAERLREEAERRLEPSFLSGLLEGCHGFFLKRSKLKRTRR